MVSSFSIIFSIIRKDFLEIVRDRLWVFLSILGLVIYIALYWVLPSTVDETLTIGIYQKDMDEIFQEYSQEEGVKIVEFESVDELKENIEEIGIGIVFPEDFLEKTLLGEKTTVQIYSDSAVPKDIQNAMSSFVREMALGIHGLIKGEDTFPVEFPDEELMVLGEDRLGDQISFRQKIKPLLAILVLMVESMALASLIAVEIQNKTVVALLATPARLKDLLFAKTIFGTLLAFSQAFILLAVIGALGQNALILLTMILLGSIMVTGIAFISGTAGKDFMGTLLYSMFFLIPLMIPTLSVFFPGSASVWVKILPTYGLVEGIMRSSVYGQGWLDIMPFLLMVVAWNIVIFSTGLLIFKHRVQKL